MSKFIVVTVHRDRWRFPKLTIKVEANVSSEAAGRKFVERRILELFDKRSRGKFGIYSSMRVFDFRVVDEVGLRRLRAAAKASATLRRKRAAKKAAETRAKNKAKIAERVARMNAARLRGSHGEMKSPVTATEFYPVYGDGSLN